MFSNHSSSMLLHRDCLKQNIIIHPSSSQMSNRPKNEGEQIVAFGGFAAVEVCLHAYTYTHKCTAGRTQNARRLW